MFKQASTSLAQELIEIASHVKDSSDDGFHMHDNVMYCLDNEHHLKLIKLSQALIAKANAVTKISGNYAFSVTRSLFAKIINSSYREIKDTALGIEEAMKLMHQYDVEQTVYLRVNGILLKEPISLGSVDFLMCTSNVLEQTITQIYDKIDLPHDKRKSHFDESFTKNFRSRCIAVFKVVAEPVKAHERALDETRRALEILRYASTNINFGQNVRFGLDGDQSFEDTLSFVSSTETAKSHVNTAAPVQPFRLDSAGVQELHDFGAFKLGDFLTDPNISEFKELLLRAVHWHSSALLQTEKEKKYLHLVIALEALFTQKKGDPISNTIAESTALVINNTLSGRLQIKALVKKCYNTRSAIAHGGKSPVTDADLQQLTIIVWNTIHSLIKKADEFKTQDDLRKHLENLKFS